MSILSWQSIIFAVSACNREHDRCYIKDDLRIGFKGRDTDTAASTEKVIRTFLTALSTYLQNIDGFTDSSMAALLQQASSQLCTFIDADSELSMKGKRALRIRTLDKMKQHVDSCQPIRWLQRIHREFSAGNKTLTQDGIRHIELALDTMALERFLVVDCINIIFSLFMKSMVRTRFSELGGALVSDMTPGHSPFDLEQIPKESADEFALVLALKRAKLNSPSNTRKTLKRLLKENSQAREFPVVKIIQLFMVSVNTTYLFEHFKKSCFAALQGWGDTPHRPMLFERTPAIIKELAYATQTAALHVSKVYMLQVQQLVQIHIDSIEEMNALYSQLAALYSDQRVKLQYTSPIQKRIVPIQTFFEAAPTSVKINSFEKRFLADLPTLLAATLTDQSMTALFASFCAYIESKSVPIRLQESKEVEELEHSFSGLKLGDVEAEEVQDEILPNDTYHRLVDTPPPLKTAPRVRDWLKKRPKILESGSYLHLSEREKEEAVVVHSFPIMISHFLRSYVLPSAYGEKRNPFYTAPGTIEWYGARQSRVEGTFEDCYDVDTNVLYHHYFNRKSFKELLTDTRPFIEEQDPLTTESEPMKLSCSRFIAKKNSMSITVDDTFKQVRFTIAFPDRL